MLIHFIGIKGSGMSSLATIMKDRGEDVQGSDIDTFIFTQQRLEERNIRILPFDEHNIVAHSTVIIGNAFDESNVEVKKALSMQDVIVYRYHEFLGKLMKNYTSICVAGTHGKTTTTGMLAHVLEQYEPTGFLIGDGHGDMPENGKNFVVEACEYKRHFLAYFPDYAIINNIELDHVDYYKSMQDYRYAFSQFFNQCSNVVMFGDDKEVRNLQINEDSKIKRVLYFGLEKHNDVQAIHIIEDENGTAFDVLYKGEMFGHFVLPMVGMPMLWDSLAVIALGIMMHKSATTLEEGLRTFPGVQRRFVIEEVEDNVYIDDYAHHPTAIKYMIDAVRIKYPNRKVVAIFKPDRYSRIETFSNDFASSLSLADKVYLCDFPKNAIREDGVTVTIEDLKNKIDHATIIDEGREGAFLLDQEKPAVYLFMSSKDIYKLKNIVKSFH